MNVLLYGETGTGKTQLARLLARDVSARLFVVGRSGDDGESPSAQERLSSLVLGHRLLSEVPALLLFDELEDLFEPHCQRAMHPASSAAPAMSKQWFNHLLETNPLPTIWITNDATSVDRAFLRRFMYVMEFCALGPRQRARVLGRQLGATDTLSATEVESIAERFAASPAQFVSAVQATRLIAADGRVDATTLQRVLAPTEKLVTGIDPLQRSSFDARSYRLEVLNATQDLGALADRVASWRPGGEPGLSLCLYGPPGTGKSEYIKFLAHRMGRPVLHKRASDILSCWVGGTERQIADAFSEAQRDNAVLLFDEVDSFLRDRRTAMRSWELTEVNEFLQQLEVFRGVVACTTNLWQEIDAAALRRFTFTIEFGYLRSSQALLLFQCVFGQELGKLSEDDVTHVAAALARARDLTPGDFAAVARRHRALGGTATAQELANDVVAQARAKNRVRHPLGFGP